MSLGHAHVGAVALEADQLVRTIPQTCMVVTAHANVRFEPRETARAAGETLFWGEGAQFTRDARYTLLLLAPLPSSEKGDAFRDEQAGGGQHVARRRCMKRRVKSQGQPFVTTYSQLLSRGALGVVAALAATAACGGSGSDDGAGPTTCPASSPKEGDECGKPGLHCSYGGCNIWSCADGKFVYGGGGCNPPPVCPPEGTPLPAAGSDCTGYSDGAFGSGCPFPTQCGMSRQAHCQGPTWSLEPDPCVDAGPDASPDAEPDALDAQPEASSPCPPTEPAPGKDTCATEHKTVSCTYASCNKLTCDGVYWQSDGYSCPDGG